MLAESVTCSPVYLVIVTVSGRRTAVSGGDFSSVNAFEAQLIQMVVDEDAALRPDLPDDTSWTAQARGNAPGISYTFSPLAPVKTSLESCQRGLFGKRIADAEQQARLPGMPFRYPAH